MDERGRRIPWLFVALLALSIGAIAWVQLMPDQDPGQTNLITLASIVLMVVSTAIFIARRRNLPAAVRFAPLAAIVAGLAVFFSLYRFVGWSSMLTPLFESRWTKRDALSGIVGQTLRGGDLTQIVPVSTTPHDFPGFLGPNRDHSITSVRLARDWEKEEPELLWRQPIGLGWSGFAVVGDYAITQEQRDDTDPDTGEARSREMVVCYDLKTGKVRWAHGDDVRFGLEQSFGGVGPRATPTLHNGRVFAIGATGILNALELATGRHLWSKAIREDSGAENVFWGTACSPLIVDDLVVVSAGGDEGKSLVAYRQVDGARAWSGGDDFSSYASPSLATLCGIRQVLIVNEDWVTGHDAEDGRVLWTFKWPGKTDQNANTSQAHVVPGDRVFISKGYTQGAGLFQFDADRLQKARDAGEVYEPERLWDKETIKRAVLKTKHSNVCFHGEYVYGLDEDLLQCVELATGKQQWKRGRYGQGQLLLIDDLLLATAEDGRVALVEANPEKHVELGSFQAIEGEPCWNCPALAGPYLLVRNKYEAACYKLPMAAND